MHASFIFLKKAGSARLLCWQGLVWLGPNVRIKTYNAQWITGNRIFRQFYHGAQKTGYKRTHCNFLFLQQQPTILYDSSMFGTNYMSGEIVRYMTRNSPRLLPPLPARAFSTLKKICRVVSAMSYQVRYTRNCNQKTEEYLDEPQPTTTPSLTPASLRDLSSLIYHPCTYCTHSTIYTDLVWLC